MDNDEVYMRRALALAERGMGFTAPNPMVGAVVVKDGRIIGEGWHRKYGLAHAERDALAKCTEDPSGATIYVTLEPCCHYGKTPPCTSAIIESGLKRVVIGSDDCNPLVKGRSKAILRDAGIDVTDSVLKDECDRLNAPFFWFISRRTPYVVMKYAMTADGKISAHTGLSKWITSEEARRRVHLDRKRYTAVMVGVGTVLQDDPLLTCRVEGGRNPIRIVCDTSLRTPLDSNLAKSAKDITTLIATACEDDGKLEAYTKMGFKIIMLPKEKGHISLTTLMERLGGMGIDSILLEGGAALNWSALESKIVNHVQTYIAPKILGGDRSKTPVGGTGAYSPDEAYRLKICSIERIGDDILMESDVIYDVHGDC